MPYIDFNTRKKINIWPGISGPVFHSDQATFGHFTLEQGADVAEHQHPHEQWTHVIEGSMEFNIAGDQLLLQPGMTAFIPSNTPHSARAITTCKVIDCFFPVREEFRALENQTG